MALITGSVEPRPRGSFMSFNASIQQLGSGLAAMVAGLIIGRAADGSLTGYGIVSWLAVGATLLRICLARRIKVVGNAGADCSSGPDCASGRRVAPTRASG